MKRLAICLFAVALGTLAVTASAQAAFGLKSFDVTYENEDGSSATQAGSHPFAVTSTVEFSTKEDPKNPGNVLPDGSPKDLIVGLPAGLVGDREAVPRCSNDDFLLVDADHEYSNCPNDTVVGVLADVRRPGKPPASPLLPSTWRHHLAPRRRSASSCCTCRWHC